MRKLNSFLIGILLIFSINIYSRNIKFEHISTKISYGGIFSLLEDKKGFIWFGTIDGLYKYDGNGFVIFKPKPGDKNSISNQFIINLYEDRDGFIWICTNKGLNMFNPQTEKFDQYYPKKDDFGSGINNINVFLETKKGDIWVGTSTGLFRFMKKEKKFILWEKKGFLKDSTVTSIIEDNENNLWVGTFHGLFKINIKKNMFIHFDNKNKKFSNLDNQVKKLYINKEGDIYIGTNKGIYIYDKKNDSFISYKHLFNDINFSVQSILEDKNKDLWIGTMGNGLYLLDKNRKTSKHYIPNRDNPFSIRGRTIYSIIESRNGTIWISTDTGWLEKIRFDAINYKQYFIKKKIYPKVTNRINCVFLSKPGEFLIGSTYNGLFKYTNNTFSKINFYSLNKNFSQNAIITTICRDKDGFLWIGSVNGLLRIDEKNNTHTLFKSNPNDKNSLRIDTIIKLYEDRKGILWIGTGAGLEKYDKKKNSFIHYHQKLGDKNSLSNNAVFSILEDSFGNFWVGTFGGLNKFDRDKKIFTRYMEDKDDPYSISNNKIVCVFEDSRKILWIGTLGGGINRYDRIHNNFKVYNKKNGLIFNMVSGIIEDNFGKLWIPTMKGISIFNPKNERFDNYHIGGFNLNTTVKNTDGNIFIGGIGLYEFSNSQIKKSQTESTIILTNFKIFNVPVKISNDGSSPLKKSISETKEITLDYKQNVFSFEFSLLDFSNKGEKRYKYKMEGFNKNWINLGTKHDITFTNLDPGKYLFRVKGKNSNGVWNQRGISLNIIITPPFWQELWFKTIFIVFFIILLFVLYKKRIKIIESKIKKEYNLSQFFLKYNISEREKEILKLIVNGKTNREIEEILFISYHTVRNHIRNIYKKLNIKNKADLIILLGPINSNTIKEEI